MLMRCGIALPIRTWYRSDVDQVARYDVVGRFFSRQNDIGISSLYAVVMEHQL